MIVIGQLATNLYMKINRLAIFNQKSGSPNTAITFIFHHSSILFSQVKKGISLSKYQDIVNMGFMSEYRQPKPFEIEGLATKNLEKLRCISAESHKSEPCMR